MIRTNKELKSSAIDSLQGNIGTLLLLSAICVFLSEISSQVFSSESVKSLSYNQPFLILLLILLLILATLLQGILFSLIFNISVNKVPIEECHINLKAALKYVLVTILICIKYSFVSMFLIILPQVFLTVLYCLMFCKDSSLLFLTWIFIVIEIIILFDIGVILINFSFLNFLDKDDISIKDSLKSSKKIIKNYFIRIISLHFSFILWLIIIAFFRLFISIMLSSIISTIFIPYYFATLIQLYFDFKKDEILNLM